MSEIKEPTNDDIAARIAERVWGCNVYKIPSGSGKGRWGCGCTSIEANRGGPHSADDYDNQLGDLSMDLLFRAVDEVAKTRGITVDVRGKTTVATVECADGTLVIVSNPSLIRALGCALYEALS